MRIVITGGHGFVGTALWRELVRAGGLGGVPIDRILLLDRVTRPTGASCEGVVRTLEGDLIDTLPRAFAEPVDVLFHLASGVSAECEADLASGWASTSTAPARCCRPAARNGKPAGR